MPIMTATDRLTPRSAIRYRPIASAAKTATTEEPFRIPRFIRVPIAQPSVQSVKPLPTRAHTIPQWHPLTIVGVGMLLALLLVCLGQIVVGWLGTVSDDLHYGRPRTFQVDAFVGHETGKVASHFIALNYQGRMEVIELPGGDGSHARIYLGPQLNGTDADLIPITLQFVDTRHDHHPDMLVQFRNSQICFRNTQDTFLPE